MAKKIISLWWKWLVCLVVSLCCLNFTQSYAGIMPYMSDTTPAATDDEIINSMAGEYMFNETLTEGEPGIITEGVAEAAAQGASINEIQEIAESLHNMKTNSIFSTTIYNYMREDSDACWFCTVFESVYDAINTMVKTLFNGMAKSFLSLMGVGILFFLLFKVGKMLVQLQDVDLMQFLNDLFKPLGRAIIATALLGATVVAGSQTLFYLVTNPFMEISFKLSGEIVANTLQDVQYLGADSSAGFSVKRKAFTAYNPEPANDQYDQENREAPDSAMGTANKMMMVEWMKKVSSSFIVGIAMGWTFMKIGITGTNFFSKGLPVAIAGFTLWAGFWLIYLFFPIRLLNAFVRIAFVFALMPLWIVLWVFPVTQQYTKKAWEMFLSGCLIFIVLSVMVALSLMLVDSVVPDTLYNAETGDTKTREQFFNMLIAGEDEEAKKYVAWGSGLILNCIAFTLLGWQLMEKAEVIANSFIGGAGNIQLNVGNQTAATLAKEGQVAVSGAKMAANVGLWAGKKIGAKALSAARKRFGGGGTGGGGSGNNGNNSGGGSGGGNDGGGTPPPSTDPTVLPGKKGETGNEGPEGKQGKPGLNAEGNSGPKNPPMPEGTDVREAITPPDVHPASASDTRSQTQSSSETRSRTSETTGNMGASAEADLTALSPERMKAVQSLAKEGGKSQYLQNLSQDVAFIENSLGMKRDDFMKAMQERSWLTDGKQMRDFASDAYSCRNLPTLMESATKRMLKEHGLSSAATMAEANQIAKRTGLAIEQKTPNSLSRDLNSLSKQVAVAEKTK